jgi:hypothetical protein
MRKSLSKISLLIVVAFLLFQANNRLVEIPFLQEITKTRPAAPRQIFPALNDPKNMTYDWNYQDRPYSLSFTVYGSVCSYYRDQPKGIFVGREESSLGKYLSLPTEDGSIRDLAAKLNGLAAENSLNEDQKLELAVAFVQSIPYDTEKAEADHPDPRYPYEVLFDDKGICSEKSFLMYAILREMGYGSAIFEYPQQNHMNVGVESPVQYSTDNSGYSMIETTNPGLKIGVIPNLDSSSGQALDKQAMEEFNLRNPNTTTGKQLSSPEIYAKTTGRQYSGIIQTFQNQREIADIQNFLNQEQPIIEQKETQMRSLNQQMDGYKTANNIAAYNALVAPQNRLAGELNALIDDYNANVNRYNALIKEM